MYRYLWEVPCFDRTFESARPLDTDLQRGVRRVISSALKISYNDVHLVYYQRNPGSIEVKYEAKASVEKNFEFAVFVLITTYDKTLVSLNTILSRLDPVYIRDFHNKTESIVSNMFQEFAKKSFYQDIMADYQRKYEEVSRKLFEQLEILFHLERPTSPPAPDLANRNAKAAVN